jgi:hypothetical protein
MVKDMHYLLFVSYTYLKYINNSDMHVLQYLKIYPSTAGMKDFMEFLLDFFIKLNTIFMVGLP